MKLRGWWHTFPCHRLSLRPTHFLSKSWSHVPAQIQHNTVLTPSQVLPLPLLQSRRGTTLHRIHMPTSDATALITTSCVLFYFISPFLLLKSSRSHYHTRRRCTGTTATAYARGTTIQTRPRARKPPRRRRILPLAPTPTAAIAPFAGTQVMFFFSFFFFRPFSDQCYRDS